MDIDTIVALSVTGLAGVATWAFFWLEPLVRRWRRLRDYNKTVEMIARGNLKGW